MEPGYRIAGRYELLEFLGEGRLGRAYRALDHGQGGTVTIKLPHAQHAFRPEFAARFQREFQAGQRFIHPTIVRCLDHGEFSGLPFMVCEYVEGRPIDKWFQDIDGDFERLAQGLEILLEGLAAAHHHRLVHRELKPSNTLMTAAGEPRLLDFGLAGRLEDQLRGGHESLAYLSPEQALGGRGDERSDLYSLGAILYTLVAGRPMFTTTSAAGVLLCHVNDEPTPLSRLRADVPLWLERLVARLVQKDPARRPASAREVLTQVRRRQQAVPLPAARQELWWAREEQVELLSRRLQALRSSGRGSSVWMSGPLGCGLSSLLRKTRELAAQSGLKALVLGATDSQITMLQFLRHTDLGTPPGQRRSQPTLFPASPAERVVAQVAAAVAASSGLVMLIDNFHRAQEDGVQIVAALANLCETAPLLLVVAAEEGHGASLRPRFTHELTLRGWSREVCSAFIEEHLWATPPPEMAQWIWKVSEGLPAYLRLLLERLEGKYFRVDSGEIIWTPPPVSETPESLNHLLQGLLELQGPELGELLGVAACLGESFELNLLRAVNLRDESQLEHLLEHATRTGWIEENWEGGVAAYRFTHPCRYRAALEKVPARRQRRYHLLVGAFWERAQRHVTDWEKACYHYELAQEWETALRALLKVLQACSDQENWAEARYWMRRCRGWAQELPQELRADQIFPSPWGNFGWSGQRESTGSLHFLAAQLHQLGADADARWYLQMAFEEGLEDDPHRWVENRLLTALCLDRHDPAFSEQLELLLQEAIHVAGQQNLEQHIALASALRLQLKTASAPTPEPRAEFEGFRAPE